jgi:predicted flap endonuclease-1-like 5' DNA nuclease
LEQLRRDVKGMQSRLAAGEQVRIEFEASRKALAATQAEHERLREEYARMKSSLDSTTAELDTARTQITQLQGQARLPKAPPQRPAAAKARPTGRKATLHGARPKAKGAAAPQHKDRLELIDGIGREYERRLNRAGVHTFDKLAKMSPKTVRNIIKPKDWQKIEPEKWSREAARLANKAAASRRR